MERSPVAFVRGAGAVRDSRPGGALRLPGGVNIAGRGGGNGKLADVHHRRGLG